MKISERIVDGGIRDIGQLSSNQCGFVADNGTIDAIHATRLLLEKHSEKQKPVHIAFLDLEKAFDLTSSSPVALPAFIFFKAISVSSPVIFCTGPWIGAVEGMAG
ncbi:unnamed protein product [Heligmosomoides polygyrus]|uniref:Reverse transcriptase domain-containing protein n=1 Tax=Heligmosomoides polygyrus TaxID=6339 RepID=A0A183GT46_HELPZ|nr:unnamed protein product [Heligmosomoides polygyrus]